jgi:hypothetical protein
VFINILMTLMAFGAGFFIANRMYNQFRYVNTIELLHRFGMEPPGFEPSGFVPHGKLGTGTYYIPYDRGRRNILCRIVGGQATGTLHELDIGCVDPSTPTFTLVYKNHDRFHTPVVSLQTGHPGTCWFDLGLKGRFLLKSGPKGNTVTYLNGAWVPFDHPSGDAFEYNGKEYRYNKVTGNWEISAASSARAAKQAHE